jgi:2,3-bisphosphoglycerate-independent phosphoglycerate mutase
MHSGLIQAFSILCEQLVNAIKELRVLNMDIINTELAQRRLEQNYQIKTGNTTNNIQNNVYMLDSKSLDEMIKNHKLNKKQNTTFHAEQCSNYRKKDT